MKLVAALSLLLTSSRGNCHAKNVIGRSLTPAFVAACSMKSSNQASATFGSSQKRDIIGSNHIFSRKPLSFCPVLSTIGGSISTPSNLSTKSNTSLNSAVSDAAEKSTPTEVFRSDYKPLPFTVSTISMDFDIIDGKTTVTSTITFLKNAKFSDDVPTDMVLDGDETCV